VCTLPLSLSLSHSLFSSKSGRDVAVSRRHLEMTAGSASESDTSEHKEKRIIIIIKGQQCSGVDSACGSR